MKRQNKYSIILSLALLSFVSLFALGAFKLSLERREQANIALRIKSCETQISKLKIERDDLKVKIANQENPHLLKIRASSRLAAPSDKMVVWAGYENFEGGRVESSPEQKLVLQFRTPSKLAPERTAQR